MKNFLVRTITAVIYVTLLVGCLYWGPITAFFFFATVSAACTWEFGKLMNRKATPSTHIPLPVLAMSSVVLQASMWLFCIGAPNYHEMFALYGLMMLYLIISQLYRRHEHPIQEWAMALASQVYVALPFALLPMLFMTNEPMFGSFSYTYTYCLALFIFVWISDTGAYIIGVTLGRYFPWKLFSSISPNKSWVGSIGGGLLTVGVSMLAWYSLPHSLTLLQWIGFALVVVVFGTWGDLVESQLKRYLNIKDSGTILPGHGGMLDRFDSSLLAIPASVIYFSFIL